MNIKNNVHVGNYGNGRRDGAFWHQIQNAAYYGDGDNYLPWTSLDICAHELGHGICQYTSNLAYTFGSESSALNEGFSDIWGACVSFWAAPNKQHWLIGEETCGSNNPPFLRSLIAPKTAFDPCADCYGSNTWIAYNDPHRRSGVLSKWFQLLSDGGVGTNDLGNTYSVSGITIDKAAKIAYLTEQLLTSNADYEMARIMSIQAAIQIYGTNSCEEFSVKNAWYAVGLGTFNQPLNISIGIGV